MNPLMIPAQDLGKKESNSSSPPKFSIQNKFFIVDTTGLDNYSKTENAIVKIEQLPWWTYE